jgi:hypothetical protein
MLKKASSKAAADESAAAQPFEARTMPADYFNESR